MHSAVCSDFYNARLTMKAIAIKHHICYESVRKILDVRKVPPALDAPFDPQVVKERQTMDPLTRTLEVKKDAQATVELTLALIHHQVAQDMERVIAANEKFPPKLSLRELTDFFDKSAPYVLGKIDAPKRAASEKEATSAIKRTHKMFKDEAQNQPKPKAQA